MNQLLFAILCSLLLLTLAPAASAADETDSYTRLVEIMRKSPPDAADYERFILMLKDDPQLLLRDLYRLWASAKQNHDFRLEAQTGWFIGRAASYELKLNPGWDMNLLFKDTIRLIEDHKIPLSTKEIEFFELSYQTTTGGQGVIPVQDRMIALARQIENPGIRAYAISIIAFDLADRGDYTDLPKYFSEIREYLQMNGPDMRITDVDTLTGLSVALDKINQTAEAQAIYRKLDALCESHVMREFCSSRAYESGRTAMIEDKVPQAIAAFSRALDLSTEILDNRRIALSYYGLSKAHQKLKNNEKAVFYAKKSAEMFAQTEMNDWAASALVILSKVYQDMQKNQEALAAAQQALALCPGEYKADRMMIYKQLSATYEQLNRPADALSYLKLYGDLDKELNADDAQKKYMSLRNEALSAQNEMQASQINLLKKFRVVSILAAALSLFSIVALILLAHKSRLVRASQKKMREIMDHLDEGILILDRQLRIRSGYSPYLDTLFGSPNSALAGSSFLDLIFPLDVPENQENRILAQSALVACIGESSWSWDLNEGHLPHEVNSKGKTLAIHWQALYNDQKQIFSFLVSVRDESQLRAMQKFAQHQEQRVQLLQVKLQEILGGKPALIRQLLGQILDEWGSLQQGLIQGGAEAQTLRRLHTFKGGARTLGLKELSTHIHEMESLLVNRAATSMAAIEEQWNHIRTVAADYHHLLDSLVTKQTGDDRPCTDLYGYASLYAEEAEKRLQEGQCQLKGVRVLDQIRYWDHRALDQINAMILHGISNSVDHGFVRPRLSKLEPALIEIEATYAGDAIKLVIADNGAGIDMNFINSKAQTLGFVPESGRPFTDILFLDGLSTAAAVSPTSGRGVGLSAISSICKDLQAIPEIGNRIGGGTLLTIVLPLALSDFSRTVQVPVKIPS